MNMLTHNQTQRLLHYAADRKLSASEQTALDRHLATCPTCSRYAQESAQLQAIFQVVSARTPTPRLNRADILSRVRQPGARNQRLILLGRFATLTAAVVIGAWLTFTGIPKIQSVMPLGASPSIAYHEAPASTPTPTGTLAQPTCEMRTYIVQPGDKLENIASRFNVAAETIATYNHLNAANNVAAGQTLVIPSCGQPGTPTLTSTSTGTPSGN